MDAGEGAQARRIAGLARTGAVPLRIAGTEAVLVGAAYADVSEPRDLRGHGVLSTGLKLAGGRDDKLGLAR